MTAEQIEKAIEKLKKSIYEPQEQGDSPHKTVINVERVFEKIDKWGEVLENELERVSKNIVELPCNIGDEIWFKMTNGNIYMGKVIDYTHFISCGFCAVIVSSERTFPKMNVPFRVLVSGKNKTIFFTKEEAEKALKERR